MTPQTLQLDIVYSDAFGQNSHIAHLNGRSDCLVIDPGFDDAAMERFLQEKGLQPAAILNTHGHIDHIAGNRALKERYPDCPLVIGVNEADKLTDPLANLSTMLGTHLTSPEADTLVRDGEVFSAAGIELEIVEAPGHSKGHILLLCKSVDPWIAVVGDVLFMGGIGRTDFPDGDTETLLSTIRRKLYTLPDSTVVLSGHGPNTTIGDEKRTNPFVRA